MVRHCDLCVLWNLYEYIKIGNQGDFVVNLKTTFTFNPQEINYKQNK